MTNTKYWEDLLDAEGMRAGIGEGYHPGKRSLSWANGNERYSSERTLGDVATHEATGLTADAEEKLVRLRRIFVGYVPRHWVHVFELQLQGGFQRDRGKILGMSQPSIGHHEIRIRKFLTELLAIVPSDWTGFASDEILDYAKLIATQCYPAEQTAQLITRFLKTHNMSQACAEMKIPQTRGSDIARKAFRFEDVSLVARVISLTTKHWAYERSPCWQEVDFLEDSA